VVCGLIIVHEQSATVPNNDSQFRQRENNLQSAAVKLGRES